MSLKDYLKQQETLSQPYDEKTAVFCFGRFNPPTQGHGKLIEKVIDLATQLKCEHFIIPSQSVDNISVDPIKMKNPLPFEIKVAFMKQVYPNVNIVESGPTDPWKTVEWLSNQGYTEIKMVIGSDRLEEFQRLVEHAQNFVQTFELVNAGYRDPDRKGTVGMSASKAREAALLEDIGKFRVATGWSDQFAENLMKAIRISMGVE